MAPPAVLALTLVNVLDVKVTLDLVLINATPPKLLYKIEYDKEISLKFTLVIDISVALHQSSLILTVFVTSLSSHVALSPKLPLMSLNDELDIISLLCLIPSSKASRIIATRIELPLYVKIVRFQCKMIICFQKLEGDVVKALNLEKVRSPQSDKNTKNATSNEKQSFLAEFGFCFHGPPAFTVWPYF